MTYFHTTSVENRLNQLIEKYANPSYECQQYQNLVIYLKKGSEACNETNDSFKELHKFLKGYPTQVALFHNEYKAFLKQEGLIHFGLNVFERKLQTILNELSESLKLEIIFYNNRRSPKFLILKQNEKEIG